MSYIDIMDAQTGFIAIDKIEEKGKELSDRYNGSSPFPSIMIDDFLPEQLADALLADFGSANRESSDNQQYFRAQEKLKTSFHPDTMGKFSRAVFYAFNSRPFIKVIENITGIKGLIPDPYYMGAGYHEIQNGGHLSVHADFNQHKILNLERRINILIYLNKDWKDEYGGQLELWTDDMKERVQCWTPDFNRCVIFNTTSDSMHGNPQVVNNPLGISRKSIALYYYTATWDATKRSHTTQFQVRPGTKDQFDWVVKRREWKNDFLPPVLNRAWERFRSRMR